MSGIVEDLRERVDALEAVVVKLCRRAGHDEWMGSGRDCVRHANRKFGEWADEQCTTCGVARCCDAAEME